MSEDNVMCREPNLGWSPPGSRQLPPKPDFTRVHFIKKAVQEYVHVKLKKN